MCLGVPVLPARVEDTPPFREDAHQLGGDLVECGLGLFQRLERAVGEGVEGVLKELGELGPFVRGEQRLRARRTTPGGTGLLVRRLLGA
jgi:hypothetical protein